MENRKMSARTLWGRQYGMFKELKNTRVVGVGETWEDVNIKLEKVYNSAL